MPIVTAKKKCCKDKPRCKKCPVTLERLRKSGYAERLSRQRRQSEKEQRTGATGTLVKDPETGEYRLRRDDE